MKKGIYCIIIVLICIILATVYAMANSKEQIVEKLITKRTDALSLYYSGYADKEDTKTIIEKITTDYLRDEDLANIDRFFQSDLEQINGYKITKIDITSADEDVICAYVTIDWNSQNYEEEENFIHTYSTICKKEENLYKLAQFF